MHHQVGVHFENFTEVKFRDILLIGAGYRDRCLNRDSPGQTGRYGRSTDIARSFRLKMQLHRLIHIGKWTKLFR